MTAGRTALEAALVAAVLAPLALHPVVRRTVSGLSRPRLAVLAAMFALMLAGQLALQTRSFPFVNWHMYATTSRGNVTVYEYDAVLRSGASIPLVPGRILAPESADRLMEALRRQVDHVKAAGSDRQIRRVHEQTLAAIARRYDEKHSHDRVTAVIVSQRTVAIDSGKKSPSRLLWQVALR